MLAAIIIMPVNVVGCRKYIPDLDYLILLNKGLYLSVILPSSSIASPNGLPLVVC